MTQLSIVLPVLNEETLVHELLTQVQQNVTSLVNEYEIIIIDDGSTDQTWNLISKKAIEDKNIKAIKFSRNFGHHYAITAGLNKSKGEWVIVMDADLQDKPQIIPELYEKAQEGYDVVFVSRHNRPETKFYLGLQKLFYFILNLITGMHFDSSHANFSIISRKVVEAFNNFPENARFYGSTIMWLGFKRTQIAADHGIRHSGSSSYTISKRIKLALDISLSFSERPLKFAIFVGMIFSTFSVIYSAWILYASIMWSYTVEGWSSIMISIYFVSGILFMVLGVLGVYLGRVFREVKRRPLYVIEDLIN
jgi:glycosyltransferase involved in cell wall biosynthesis